MAVDIFLWIVQWHFIKNLQFPFDHIISNILDDYKNILVDIDAKVYYKIYQLFLSMIKISESVTVVAMVTNIFIHWERT